MHGTRIFCFLSQSRSGHGGYRAILPLPNFIVSGPRGNCSVFNRCLARNGPSNLICPYFIKANPDPVIDPEQPASDGWSRIFSRNLAPGQGSTPEKGRLWRNSVFAALHATTCPQGDDIGIEWPIIRARSLPCPRWKWPLPAEKSSRDRRCVTPIGARGTPVAMTSRDFSTPAAISGPRRGGGFDRGVDRDGLQPATVEIAFRSIPIEKHDLSHHDCSEGRLSNPHARVYHPVPS